MNADDRARQAGSQQTTQRPAQVPGDAESPAKGTVSEAAKKAPNKTDPTEATRSARDTKR